MFKTIRAFVVMMTVAVFVWPLSVSAAGTILTIDGNIAGQAPVEMSIEDVEALGSKTVVTKTPWHESATTFEGVLITDLIEKLGAEGNTLSVLALNNYYSEIPVADLRKYGVILAYKQNGAYMPVSDKGPLFVVYPFDTHSELQDEVYFARSVWQVRSITVE